jgi:CheY-like chemotaxis protein
MQAAMPNRVRVAVVDADTAFLDFMHDLLEAGGGYDVAICREWQDAHQFIKDQQPSLVILDIRIGNDDRGWAILELLTLDPATRPIPVIVCSAAILITTDSSGGRCNSDPSWCMEV